MFPKLTCTIKGCKFPKGKAIKMKVLHPSGPRWQTWKVCVACGRKIIYDKELIESGQPPYYEWHSIYYKDPKRRKVIEIGEVISMKIDMI